MEVADLLELLRQFNLLSVVLRLALAMLCGGMIGLERARKRRPAGFRTYMLVCMGAALTMLLGQYEVHMLESAWAEAAEGMGRTDVTRFAAHVVSGIGFLGAGTIIVTGRLQVKGLTTAAGLWASGCMGLAVGAGFYECVASAFLLILLAVHVLPRLERRMVGGARDMNLYIEFQSMDDMGEIIRHMKAQGVRIYDMEIDRSGRSQHPGAVFSLYLGQKGNWAKMIAAVSEIEQVRVIRNI